MKAILMSIHPKWCEKIFNGEKTIEVRKTAPKIEMPFTVYVYQTKIKVKKGDSFMVVDALNENLGCGKVIGSFVCDRIDEFDSEYSEWAYACAPTGIPCAMPMSEGTAIEICKEKACLTHEDIVGYFGDEEWRAYFWNIIEPKLFDKPRDLGEFKHKIKVPWAWQENGKAIGYFYKWQPITRAPQSWVYCETIDEK